MKRKTILIVMFSVLLFNVIYANGTEKERPTYWEEAKVDILASLDSLIENNIPIDFNKMELESRDHIMRGDVRQIEFYFRFMTDGVKVTQKIGIDGIAKWWYKPEGGLDPRSIEWLKMAGEYVVIDADSSYFNKYKSIIIKKLYEFLDDEYPAIKISAGRALITMGIQDSVVIQIIKYYAKGTNSGKWNLEYTSYYTNTTIDFYLKQGKTAYDRKRDAIRELMRNANKGLEILTNKGKDSSINSINSSENYSNYRDLDWEGISSANYCIEYYEIYNPDYTSYLEDCANFASQCLIAGHYDDIIPASASYPTHFSPEGCITWCSSLHDYLSNRFDIVTTIVDFHTNGWEIGDEPNNHIPANFSVGDIVIVGFHEEGTGQYQGHYKHAIICHDYDGNGYELFGAHTTNNINKTMDWFIDSSDAAWDYATFYHITNNWNCNTQIAGGAVSGTWTHENSPYCINGEITIPLGSELTIEPGVDVIFTGPYKFNIYGRLLAEGDWQRYINFTAQNHTTGWNGSPLLRPEF